MALNSETVSDKENYALKHGEPSLRQAPGTNQSMQILGQIVNDYDHEMPQLHTTDSPMAPPGKVKEL